ncbi:hypothetical protein Tco_0410113 [Tanacetum coccineum]
MTSTTASISKASKRPKINIIPPKQLFVDLTRDDTKTPSPEHQLSSPSAWSRIFKKMNKKKAKNKQIQARNGKDKVKSQPMLDGVNRSGLMHSEVCERSEVVKAKEYASTIERHKYLNYTCVLLVEGLLSHTFSIRIESLVRVLVYFQGEVLSGPSDLSEPREKSNHRFLEVDSKVEIPLGMATLSE